MKDEFIEMLNEVGPSFYHPEDGERCPWTMLGKYGKWLEENDPVAFNIGLREFEDNK